MSKILTCTVFLTILSLPEMRRASYVLNEILLMGLTAGAMRNTS